MRHYRFLLSMLFLVIVVITPNVTYGWCVDEGSSTCCNIDPLPASVYRGQNATGCYCWSYDTVHGTGVLFNNTGPFAQIVGSQCYGNVCNVTLKFYDPISVGNFSTELTAIYNASTYTEVCDQKNITIQVIEPPIYNNTASSLNQRSSSSTSSSSSGSGSSSMSNSPLLAPTVLSFSKDAGVIGNVITTTITGNNFATGSVKPTVKLVSGSNTINVIVTGVTSNQITCNIDLTSTPQTLVGSWDVVVTNPDGGTGTLVKGFLLQSGLTPEIDTIETQVIDGILTITIYGINFINGVDGIQVLLISDVDTIAATIITVTNEKIVCVINIADNSEIFLRKWDVQVSNSDQISSKRKSILIDDSSVSTPGASKSWIIPAVIAPTLGAVGVLTTATVFILHKHKMLCFNKNRGDIEFTAYDPQGAAPFYSTEAPASVAPFYSTDASVSAAPIYSTD